MQTDNNNYDDKQHEVIPYNTIEAMRSSDELLHSAPSINRLYEKMNNSSIAKFIWASSVAVGMALYNYRKETVSGNSTSGISSAAISLGCNICVSYEFCLKSPFLAIAALSRLHKKPSKSLLNVILALIASGALTAQLVHQQPLIWSMLIGSSAFLNYSATRLWGLIDNDRSWKGNLVLGSTGIAVFFPLVCVWMGDTASLFSAPSLPKMVSHNLDRGLYVAGSASALFGIVGSFITVIFYCQAAKSVPAKLKILYHAWRDLLHHNLGMSNNFSGVLGGIFAFMTAACLGYVGYYSMTGFYFAVLSALACSPVVGEMCWFTSALNLSLSWADILATLQQVLVGLVNTGALIPIFVKFLDKLTFFSNTTVNRSLPPNDQEGETARLINSVASQTFLSP